MAASALYEQWKEDLISGVATAPMNGTIKAMLIDDSLYAYSHNHSVLADVPVAAQMSTGEDLLNKTFLKGVFDADDITWNSVVQGASDGSADAILIYRDGGSLIGYIDAANVTNLSLTVNGGDVTCTWNALGIFKL